MQKKNSKEAASQSQVQSDDEYGPGKWVQFPGILQFDEFDFENSTQIIS